MLGRVGLSALTDELEDLLEIETSEQTISPDPSKLH